MFGLGNLTNSKMRDDDDGSSDINDDGVREQWGTSNNKEENEVKEVELQDEISVSSGPVSPVVVVLLAAVGEAISPWFSSSE